MDIKGFFGEYRWLSNFWSSPIEHEGFICATVEHAYQMEKAVLNKDRSRIVAAKTPGEAKRLAKQVQIYSDWDHVKLNIMRDLLEKKFAIPQLRDKLLSTGNAFLEETNTWNDTFWGVCRGKGQNNLGKLLMQIRNEIRKLS